MAAARKIFKGSENEEASEENHDFTVISDSEVSVHHLNLQTIGSTSAPKSLIPSLVDFWSLSGHKVQSCAKSSRDIYKKNQALYLHASFSLLC